MSLLLFVLAVVGLTHIVVDAEISEPLHKWIKPRCPWRADHGLLSMLRLLVRPCPGTGPAEPPAIGCVCGRLAGSFLAQLGWLVLDSLERYAKGK